MKDRLTYISLFTLILIGLKSCDSTPLNKIDFESPGYKMYFIDIAHFTIPDRDCEFIDKYQNFYVDDQEVLRSFKNELVQEKASFSKVTNCFYVIQLLQNNEIKFGAFLYPDSKQLRTLNTYLFDLKKFETYNREFKKLEAFMVNCYSIKGSVKLISDFEKSGGYIHGVSGAENQPFRNYSGRIKLLVDTSQINQNLEYEKIEKKIKEDFSHIEEIYITHYSLLNDSIKIDILCSSDISDNIPKGYRIIESFNDSTTTEMYVYDLQRRIIDSIIVHNNIIGVEIIDLNEIKTTGNNR